jgi:hypothetical protein
MELPTLNSPTQGAFRFNTDSRELEIYDGNHWASVQATSPYLETGGVRALSCLGSEDASRTNSIEYVNMSSTGNAADFGDSTERLRAGPFALSSRTRACMGGGQNPGYSDTITYATIAQTGGAVDFGNLISSGREFTGSSNQTRGIIWGQAAPSTNIIQYITIAQTGNAVDFGDIGIGGLATANGSGYGNQTRSIFAGGYTPTAVATIQYVEYASTGNSAAFGDILPYTGGGIYAVCGCSNSVRGFMMGGTHLSAPSAGTLINTIGFTAISTLGDQQDFGDLDTARSMCYGAASATRALCMGGATPTNTNYIQYVEIATQGNAMDFGDLATNRKGGDGCSNGHGGL